MKARHHPIATGGPVRALRPPQAAACRSLPPSTRRSLPHAPEFPLLRISALVHTLQFPSRQNASEVRIHPQLGKIRKIPAIDTDESSRGHRPTPAAAQRQIKTASFSGLELRRDCCGSDPAAAETHAARENFVSGSHRRLRGLN